MSDVINPNSFEDVSQAEEHLFTSKITKEEIQELEYKDLLSRYPKVFKHGDSVVIKGEKCFCDAADNMGNTPGLGLIWVRQKMGNREILGAISIFTGMFFTVEEINTKTIRNIPDKAALIRLYEELYPKKTFFQKVMGFFKR